MKDISLRDLLTLERKYSNIYWSKNMSPYEDLSHLALHNAKMIGAMSSIAEVGQHAEKGDMKLPKLTEYMKGRIVGNYLVWALHYANEWGVNPLECFIRKQERNVKRFKSEKK